ncbi:leucine-rich repeat-containing protein kinase family protein [Mucilaginibacter antarcticus]|uniref:leucine-rich repeat-containing protein kinase family protein n=1 Tax=Mucilaginibacter antarcticus TaxID=1855725 RepID=UPI00362BDA3B
MPLLELAGFKNNQITTIPPKALNANLKWLILTNNKVNALPPEIGNCHQLQKLMLAGNKLTLLPQELSQCKNLGLLRVSANNLTDLPQWLFTMPNLAWLAFAGNSFNPEPQLPPLNLLDWKSFNIISLIGEGASGMVYKAVDTNGKQVAIKVFKGDVTSDGFPEDEIAVCLMTGTHKGLVNLVGQITGHPEGKKGLVMDLIAPGFYNLGMPPSLESCTRDIFRPDLVLTSNAVINIAGTIAAVAGQIHANGIMHSDMYAHNVLTDDDGNAFFSDFGASCFYDKNDLTAAPGLSG